MRDVPDSAFGTNVPIMMRKVSGQAVDIWVTKLLLFTGANHKKLRNPWRIGSVWGSSLDPVNWGLFKKNTRVRISGSPIRYPGFDPDPNGVVSQSLGKNTSIAVKWTTGESLFLGRRVGLHSRKFGFVLGSLVGTREPRL